MCITRATLGDDELSWDLVVKVARHKVSEPILQLSRPAVPNVLPRPSNSNNASCEICSALGRNSSMHPTARCFLNQSNPGFKRDEWEKVLSYRKARNLPIPDLLLPKPPA